MPGQTNSSNDQAFIFSDYLEADPVLTSGEALAHSDFLALDTFSMA